MGTHFPDDSKGVRREFSVEPSRIYPNLDHDGIGADTPRGHGHPSTTAVVVGVASAFLILGTALVHDLRPKESHPTSKHKVANSSEEGPLQVEECLGVKTNPWLAHWDSISTPAGSVIVKMPRDEGAYHFTDSYKVSLDPKRERSIYTEKSTVQLIPADPAKGQAERVAYVSPEEPIRLDPKNYTTGQKKILGSIVGCLDAN